MTTNKQEYNMTYEDVPEEQFAKHYSKQIVNPKRNYYESNSDLKYRVLGKIGTTKFLNFRRQLNLDEMKNIVRHGKLILRKMSPIVSYSENFGDNVSWIYDRKLNLLYEISKGARLYGMVRGMKGEAGKISVEKVIANISYEDAVKIAKRYKIKGESSKMYYPISSEHQIRQNKVEEGIKELF